MQPDSTTAFFPRKPRVTRVTLAMLSLLFLRPLVKLKGATTVPAASPTPRVPLIPKSSLRLNFETVASGLTAPLEVSSPGDGSGGSLSCSRPDKFGSCKMATFFQLPSSMFDRMVELMPEYDERGFLGFAFHPDFNNRFAPGSQDLYLHLRARFATGRLYRS